jgi:hypothetical protein
VILALAVFTAGVFLPVQSFFARQMEELKADVVAELEARLGRTITYDSISPSILRAVEIRGLVINGDPGEQARLLEVDRLRLFYHPLRLLFGRSDQAVAEIRIENSSFSLDHRRDEDVIRLLEQAASGGGGADRPVFELGGRNVRITYHGPDGRYEVDDVFFQSTVGTDEVTLTWDSAVAATLQPSDAAANEIRGRLMLQGTFVPETSETHLRVAVPWLSTPAFRVRNQSFDVTYGDAGVEIHKLRNNDPVDLTVTADAELQRIDVDLLAERFVPQDIVSLRGPLTAFDPWLLGEMSGAATLTWRRERGELEYNADLSGRTNNPELPEQVALGIRVTGDETEARIEELSVRPDQGELRFSGRVALPELLPEGRILLSGFRYGPSASPLSGALRVTSTPAGGFRATSGRLSYGPVAVHDIELAADARNGTTDFGLALSFDEEAESAVTVDGSVREGQRGGASIRLSRVPAGEVYALASELAEVPSGAAQPLESLVVDVRADVRFRDGAVTFEAPYVSVQDLDDLSRYVSLGATLTQDRFEVRHLRGGLGGQTVKASARADLTEDARIPFESNLTLNGRSYDIAGEYRRGQSIDVRVAEGLEAQLYFNRQGTVIFAARADDVPLPGGPGDGETVPRLSLRGGGSFTGLDEWAARIEDLSVSDPAGAGSALSLAAELGPDGGAISRFAYRDGVSRLKGEGELRFGAEGAPELSLEAATADGSESYLLTLRYAEGDLGGTLEMDDSPLRRFAAEPIRGGLGGTLTLETLLSEPRLTLEFETEDATFNTDSVSAQGTVRLTERTLVMNRVNVRYVTRSLTDARGTIDLETGEATLSASIENRERDEESRVKALVRATFDQGSLPLSFGEVGSVPFEAVVRLSNLDFPRGNEEPWELDIIRGPEDIRISGGPGGSVQGRVTADGEFRLRLSDPLPVRFLADGALTAGEIEANVTNILLDAGELSTPMEGRTVSLVDGQFTGAIRVVGAVNDPDFFGTLEASGVRGGIDFIADELGPADTFVVFQEKIVEINRFSVPTGDGSGFLTGTVILNRWTPEEYRLRIEIPEEPGVRVVYNFGGLFVDGYGRGDLKIQGTAGSTDVSGDILVDDTSLTLAEQVEPAEKRNRRTVVTVDLSFETAGPTEFLWPNQEFPVLRALAERGEELDLTYASDTESFSLRGRMDIQAGEIYYFDRSFYIRDGRILFDENEDEFDPRLAVRAEIREISTQGPVRVFLIVDEERLSSFTPRFESSPPLTDSELIALLGGNLLAAEGEDDVDFSQAVLLTSDLVTQFGVINRFERSVRDALGLDLFSVRTQLFQNLVLGSLAEPQYPLDNTSPSLGQYFENTAVFLGKYLGSELFMELLFSMRSRSPFEPVPPGAGPVEFEAELGLEWQTPLFLLQWRFFPSNPETLFVTDNQIEFSWEFSY